MISIAGILIFVASPAYGIKREFPEVFLSASNHVAYNYSISLKALKLGAKKYLDEILLELTDPTNSPVGRELIGPPGFPPKHVALVVQTRAFEKLAYVKDRSMVKVLASFLYGKENPEDYVERGGDDIVVYQPPSEMAMRTLAQIVSNPPSINLSGTNDTRDARVRIWQQWWEQNKDKYP